MAYNQVYAIVNAATKQATDKLQFLPLLLTRYFWAEHLPAAGLPVKAEAP